jgi:hypothetical protein
LVKRFLLREYGSWAVMIISYLTGIAVSRSFNAGAAVAFLSAALFINSKQALTIGIRSRGADAGRTLAVFLLEIAAASAILILLFQNGIWKFLPYVLVPFAYIAFNLLVGEHAAITEVTGFFLIAMSALLSKYAVTSEIDPRLYIAAGVFFTAAVFKVKAQFKRRLFHRAAMLLYLVFALDVYYFLGLPVVALLPLLDNLLFSATLYKVKLRVAGWIELSKGLAFLALMSSYYR